MSKFLDIFVPIWFILVFVFIMGCIIYTTENYFLVPKEEYKELIRVGNKLNDN